MPPPSENESWIVEIGHEIIKKEEVHKLDLLPWEKLVHCLWVADYGMKNAGDLEAAFELDPNFQIEGKRLAEQLSLSLTLAAFSLTPEELEKQYEDLFEQVCDELKYASPVDAVKVKQRKVRNKAESKPQGAG